MVLSSILIFTHFVDTDRASNVGFIIVEIKLGTKGRKEPFFFT